MSRPMRGASFQGTADIREIAIAGDWAFLRNHLDVTLTPPGGSPMHLAGPVLSILRKENPGCRLARNANFVLPSPVSARACAGAPPGAGFAGRKPARPHARHHHQAAHQDEGQGRTAAALQGRPRQ